MKYSLSNDTWGQEELTAISKVIESNRFSMGAFVTQAEQDFAAKVGSNYAVMCSSGSAANLLAIAAMVYSGRLQKGLLFRGAQLIFPWSNLA